MRLIILITIILRLECVVLSQIENCDRVIPPFTYSNIDVNHNVNNHVKIIENWGATNMCLNSTFFISDDIPMIHLGSPLPLSEQFWNPFEYIIHFSQPIVYFEFILIRGGHGIDTIDMGAENFVFESHCSDLNLSSIFSCNSLIINDTIFLGVPINTFGEGSGVYSILLDNPVYEIKISGKGGGFGSLLQLCANSLNQAPLWAGVHGSEVVCGLGSLIFERYGWLAGPYTYTYTINGGTPQTFVTNEPLAEIPLSELFGGEPPPGQYTIELTEIMDGSGWPVALSCNTSHTFEVAQQPVAQFTASPSSGVTPLDVTLQNQSSNATSYAWFVNEIGGFDSAQPPASTAENPVLTLNETGVYEITLVAFNDLGCSDTTVQTVHVLEQLQVVIPNVFTPNNDGVNDWFGITSNVEADASIVILNRWGNVVFEKEFVTTPNVFEPLWDGTSTGSVTTPGSGEAVDGVYFYRVRVGDEEWSESFSGHITLKK